MAAAAPPQHKVIPGCGFLVDGFKYAAHPSVKAYFLSHAHSDHYTGLKDDWQLGPIYCSEVTARLIAHMLGVQRRFLVPLPLDTPTMVQGVELTLCDANHCPGAVQFLFLLPSGAKYIHTGDMRFSPSLLLNPHLQRFRGCDALFLDTTYCHKRHIFPPQEESIEYVASTVHRLLQEDAAPRAAGHGVQSGGDAEEDGSEGEAEEEHQPQEESDQRRDSELQRQQDVQQQQQQDSDDSGGLQGGDAAAAVAPADRGRFRRLYLIATYGIGKERLLTAVFDRCGVRLCVTDKKHAVMQKLDLPGYDPAELFTTDATATPVHVVNWGFLGETWPYFRPNFTNMEELRQRWGADEVVGFVPTGWLYEMKKETFSVRRKGACSIHLVPYSEHSSYEELQAFVRFLRPHQVIPTVGVDGSDADRAREKMQREFRLLVDETASKQKFFGLFQRGGGNGGGSNTTGASSPPPLQQQFQQPEQGPEQQHSVHQQGQQQQQQGSDEGKSWKAAAAASSSQAGEDPQLKQLLDVLGEGVSRQRGRQLLAVAKGDLAAAINGYFEGQAAGGGSGAAGSRAAARPASAASPTPTSTGSGQAGGKRAAPSPVASKGGGGGKRQKGMASAATGTRSITAFFTVKQAAPHDESDLAMTSDVPLAVLPSSAAASGSSAPKLMLPPPPSPHGGSPAAAAAAAAAPSPGRSFLPQMGAAGSAAAAGGGKEAAVPADAMALPPDHYQPIAHACWSPGKPAPYLHLARALELMDATTSRTRISDVLTNCFLSLLALRRPRDELAAAAYLATGRIAPDYELGSELNVSSATVVSAITEATGASKEHISELYKQLGDLGDVAQALKRSQALLARPAPLTLPGVLAVLRQIAAEKGQGSKGRRQKLVLSLLRACRETETKFITRTLVQALRVGASWRTVVPALGKAAVLHTAPDGQPPSKAQLDAAGAAATAAFHICPNIPLLIDSLLDHPPEEWRARCPLTPGIPIKAMLAKPSKCIEDALAQLKGAPFIAEWKYDGVRAQIHIDAAAPPNRQVHIFSRNSEDKTAAYPDVAEHALAAMAGGATSAIIDAEVVGVELAEDGSISRLRAFQELAGRRTVNVVASSVEVRVCIFAFDILYRDSQNLTGLPLAERRAQLQQAFPCHAAMRQGHFMLAQGAEYAGTGSRGGDGSAGVVAGATGAHLPKALAGAEHEGQDHGAAEEPAAAAAGAAHSSAVSELAAGGTVLEERLQESLLRACAAGAEGLMLKSLLSPYEPSRRSNHWLKLKRDYIAGMSDSLDLVPIGAWWGNGRKAGWFSPFLLACYDPESEELQSVCRVMSGFSDDFYRQATERLGATVIEGPRAYYRTGEEPPVWFDAREVWEIRGADLTISPLHKAAVGLVKEDRGISLRFPRFVRIRDDKSPEDATTPQQVADMFNAQARKASTAGQQLAQKRSAPAPAGDASRSPSVAAAEESTWDDGVEGGSDEGASSDTEGGSGADDGSDGDGGGDAASRRQHAALLHDPGD